MNTSPAPAPGVDATIPNRTLAPEALSPAAQSPNIRPSTAPATEPASTIPPPAQPNAVT